MIRELSCIGRVGICGKSAAMFVTTGGLLALLAAAFTARTVPTCATAYLTLKSVELKGKRFGKLLQEKLKDTHHSTTRGNFRVGERVTKKWQKIRNLLPSIARIVYRAL
jgi:hypothetical protein